MCHENNHRCAAQVQHLQNVALAVELKRRIGNHRRIFSNPGQYVQDGDITIARLQLIGEVEAWLDELAPAVVQCDSLAVELRRRIDEWRVYRKMKPPTECGAGIIDGLSIAIGILDELAPDYSQCDNPPE